MNNVKEDLIKKIVECLEGKNEDREYHDKCKLDIPFMIAPLCQSLDNFKDMLNDLNTHEYGVYYEEQSNNYYSNGAICIQLSKNNSELTEEELEEKECYDTYFSMDYTYKINFILDQRYWGYCECDENDKDYDSRYGCCGHGCDWTAPSYSIEKVTYLGGNSWEGDEHDYWNFKDKFYNIDTKEKEEQQKQAKKNMLEEEIKRLQNELNKLK